jgi:ribosomal protein S18 acetylase RimI-like enzyme
MDGGPLMTLPQIHRATAKDATRTAELIADAFFALDATAWLIPDPHERALVLPADFEIYVDHALTYGEIHLIDDATGELVAAAIWFPQVTGPTPEPDNYEEQLVAACGSYTDRFRVLDQLFDDNHPHTYPHHHLAYLAARPSQQRQGLGSALLDHHHRQLDHYGTPAFLQASSEQSRKLYERHGYERLGDPFYLPDGPCFWSMWREPRQAEVGNTRQTSVSDTSD